MKMFTHALLIAALSAPLAASAQNAPAGTSQPGGTPQATETTPARKEKLTDTELQIVAHYHRDNRMQIELGKLAAQRGTNADIKSYGEMLVKDHEAFDKQLTDLVKRTGQKIPEEKPGAVAPKEELANAKKATDDLKKLKGASFDREYLRFMVDDHNRALANLDAQIAEVKNPELATLLRNVKPVLQRHDDRARELQQKEPPTQTPAPASK